MKVEIIIAVILFLIYTNSYLRDKFFDKATIGFIFLSLSLIYLTFNTIFRWQLVPLYILLIISLILNFYIGFIYRAKLLKVSSKGSRRIVVVLVSIFMIFNFVFPLNDFEYNKEEYFVGNKTYTIVDPLKKDDFNENERRKISVKLYYPSDATSFEKNVWLENFDGFEEYMVSKYNIPKYL